MAAPIVAGVAGLVLAYDPGRSWKDLRRSIVDMADPRIYDPTLSNNYNYYYQKQTGESIRRPLLGSGIVDANAALDGKKASGVFGGRLSRVQRGCSAVGGELSSGVSTSFILFLMPFLYVFVFGMMKFRTSKS
jgi:subtilisin family serine protease